ncbi:MFS transporter [Pararobbsia silviterrae]|uniref:MFS transporter n=1 Tax=Pararobbsia silviterrae TaxID=1792498 RepID=UPI001F0C974B|nr:MFS transporter [Pararobbsia silviterrae]
MTSLNARTTAADARRTSTGNLPLTGLLALTACSAIATANESVPAGLLPQLATGFGVTEAWAGQLVTACALGSALAAIPLSAALRGWPRRRVLMLVLAAFFVCNAITTVSSSFSLTLVARLAVGLATGLVWSLLASYARRMVASSQQGRALAIAMMGIPLALSLGVPLSAFLGPRVGWRWIFAAMAAASLLLIVWARRTLPDFPGQDDRRPLQLRRTLNLPGVRPVLFVLMAWILAHYILFTYIAPFLAAHELAGRLDTMLLVFGIASLIGIGMVGALVDRWLRALVLVGLGTFAAVALTLGLCGHSTVAIGIAIAAWGLCFGGQPTLMQTALADAAGDSADVAQAMLVTVFNLSYAGSGALGGILLATAGIGVMPWVILGMALIGLVVAWRAKTHGFAARTT